MEFFKFFTGFVDCVIKSMPKEEKKKKEPAAGAGAAGGAKKFSEAATGVVAQNNLIKELQMKQAQKK